MGAGKTILMSVVLEYPYWWIPADTGLGVAFLYFQHQARREQNLGNSLGCLLSQLYLRGSDSTVIPDVVREIHDRRPGLSPTVSQLQDWLIQQVHTRRRTIILLDGLDEVDQRLREELLAVFASFTMGDLQLLTTSRDLPDIKEALTDSTVLHIKAPNSSIDTLIFSHMEAPSSRRVMRLIRNANYSTTDGSSLDDTIRTKIIGTAQGISRLAVTYLLFSSLLTHTHVGFYWRPRSSI